jgi:large subunit ribosomal protein L36e
MGKTAVANTSIEGYAVGLNKGFVTTVNVNRRARNTGRRNSERVSLIAKTIKSVAGFAPYEKRAIAMYEVRNTKLDKRANRFLKKRLGSLRRMKQKSEELQNFVKRKNK